MRRHTGVHLPGLAIVLVLALSLPSSSAVIRVKTSGNDLNDGSTWNLAKRTVTAALNSAIAGDEIWVKAGTYNERIVLRDGAGLYGGFSGVETERSQRNRTANVTILDGGAAGTVVTSPAGATATTVIDGFTICHGQSYTGGGIRAVSSSPTITGNVITGNWAGGSYDAFGAGIYCSGSSSLISGNVIKQNYATGYVQGYGGGIYVYGGSPTIDNNDIQNNTACPCSGDSSSQYGEGGGVCATSAAVVISNNRIRNNMTSGGGAGVHCNGGTATITDNTITGNEYWIYCNAAIECASTCGTISRNLIADNGVCYSGTSAVFCEACSLTVSDNAVCNNRGGVRGSVCSKGGSVVIEKNAIVGNADYYAGGIYCETGTTVRGNLIFGNTASGGGGIRAVGSPVLLDNTIVGNEAPNGGGVYCDWPATPTLVNNIIAFCSSGVYAYPGNHPILRNNCVYGNASYAYSGVADPTGTSGNIALDPRLASFTYGNLHIQPDSPCRDAGDDSVIGSGWMDIDGQPRIQGAHVDIGADESDATVVPSDPRIVRVSTTGNDANDGSSWALAKRTVQAAIEAAAAEGGEVWVKAGTYPGGIVLRPVTYVYGGFSGIETLRLQRDWSANPTILDGGAPVVTGCRYSAIDGFTIRDGIGKIHWFFMGGVEMFVYYGGGIYCPYSSTSISNNIITGNTATYGAGVYIAKSFLTNNLIFGNTARYAYPSGGYGGGVYATGANQATTNNTIVNNTAESDGGGIWCYGSVQLANNIVSFNSSGVYSSGSPLLNNNCVYGNASYNYSGIAPGLGDISQDPLLGSNSRLMASSPCVNAGSDTAQALPLFDIDFEGRGFGPRVDIGADEYWSPVMSIRDAKKAADGARISGTGGTITASFPDHFYIEADDRACGIRVERAAHALTRDAKADIVGKAATLPSGERVIQATTAVESGSGHVDPLLVVGRDVGGSDSAYEPLSGAGQRGTSAYKGTPPKLVQMQGLNNIGLLVTTFGRISANYDDYFYLDDGSGFRDGVAVSPGIRVLLPEGVTLDPSWEYVAVTGVVSCHSWDGLILRTLQVREQADIVPRVP